MADLGAEFDSFVGQQKPPATNSAQLHDEFDRFLAQQRAPNTSTVEPSHYIPGGVRAPEPEPTLGERVKKRIRNTFETIGEGEGAIGETIQHPIKTLTSPDRMSNLARGVDDMVTLGAGQRLADKLGQASGYDPSWASTEQGRAKESGFRTLGNGIGMFAPGAVDLITKGGGKLAEKLADRVREGGKLASTIKGAAKGGLSYALSAPPIAAGQAAFSGEGGLDSLKAVGAALTDPIGLAVATGAGGVSGYAKGTAKHLRDPKTIEGRTLQAVQAAGGQVKPRGAPAAGGLYDNPELSSLKAGRAGMNELAEQTEESLKAHNREKLADARQAYQEGSDAVLAEHGNRAQLADNTHRVLDDMEKRATLSSGKVADKHLMNTVQELRGLLTTETSQLDAAETQKRGKPVYVTAPAVPVSDLIKVKQMVNDAAEWKAPVSRDNAPYRLIYHALGQDAAAVDPRIGQMNKAFGQTMSELEQANDILYGKRKADLPDSAVKSKGAALKLGRIGDETQAGTTDRLEQLRKLDPAYDEALKALEAKKAMERLRYGEPEVSTGLEKGMGRAAHGAVLPAVGAAMGLKLHGPLGALLGAAGGQAMSNPLALKLRLGLPVADAVSQMNGARPGIAVNRLTELAQQRKEAERQAANRLLGTQ